jgi:ATP-dependent RNA helicase DOB1
MTGDMTINPNATCLIMTTEILRSMLYRGSEVVREVAWVIYDEVHYMRDKERGVVWEESIILLPHKVRFVFLSATIPNAVSFVSWITKIHHQPCHVVYTDYRPTPLQHYLFPANADGLFLVVDEKSKFRDDNFQRAMSSLQSNPLGEFGENGGGGSGGGGGAGNEKKAKKQLTKTFQNDLLKVIKLIMERNLDPCIIFSFSKKDCESYALQLSKLDFNQEEEKQLIETVFLNAIESLSEDDQQLPQILTILPLLKKGIGIHHGGLLPILKEIIEILFQEGLIKILFATETFSIGINMPAKTVVFTATRKYDGKEFRWITSGEYIQMSGRAGRRGKDDKGIVIQMIDEKMEPDIVKNMIYGVSDPLYSSYHISYNMVLNMLRVEGADPSNLIKSSFHQFQQEANAPNLLLQINELEKEKSLLMIENEEMIEEYLILKELLINIHSEMNSLIMNPSLILPFLQIGRLVNIQYKDFFYGWGVILEVKETSKVIKYDRNIPKHLNMNSYLGKKDSSGKFPESKYYLDIMIEVYHLTTIQKDLGIDILPKIIMNENGTNPKSGNGNGNNGNNEMMIIQIGLDVIESLSAIRLNIPKDLSKEKNKINIKNCINEIIRRFDSGSSTATATATATASSASSSSSSSSQPPTEVKGIPLLDPKVDLGITEHLSRIEQLSNQKADIKARLKANKFFQLDNSSTSTAIVSSSSSSQQQQQQQQQQQPPSKQFLTKSYELFQTKKKLQDEINKLKKDATELQSIVMKEDLRRMKKVLKRLEYVTMDNILTKKGRFACEVTAGDEIVITNMVFSGLFNELSIEQSVALLSCFVHNEAGASSSNGSSTENSILKFRTEMHKPYRTMMGIVKDVLAAYKECHIVIEDGDYLSSFNPVLIDVTYAWCQGQKFIEICKISDVFEGSIIRSLRRLDELLRQLATASLSIGNHELVTLFTEGANKIRRGVVFAASLYIS